MAATEIVTRQIKDGAVTNAKVAAGAAIDTSKLAEGADFVQRDGSVAFTGNQSMGNNKLTNLGAPTAASNDAARIVDVENAVAALNSLFDSKGSVKAATTGNINLSNPGTSTFDGVSLSNGDRLLVRAQTASAENGIYVFNGSAAALTRATDMDAWAEVPGALVAVEEGTTQADQLFLCTANAGGTLGTTGISWTSVNAAAGLTNSNFVDKEVPTGSINGSNTSFSLANSPVAGSEHLYLNGLLLESGAGNDYTISGTTITMAVAPTSGEKLLVSYRK
jgi:hypothetical protein